MGVYGDLIIIEYTQSHILSPSGGLYGFHSLLRVPVQALEASEYSDVYTSLLGPGTSLNQKP